MRSLDAVFDDRRGEAPGKRRIYEKRIATGSLVWFRRCKEAVYARIH